MEVKNKISPVIRFKEFYDDYKECRLSELMSRYSENNKDEEFSIDDILSLSPQHGIVDRKELLDDAYSNVNHKNYIKTRLNDIVYGKSISANFPYGLFKVNKIRDGLLSTLYFTFRVNDKINSIYFDYYFSHYNRANNFLKKYVLVGDRYITADANYILSGKVFIPSKQEQQKISDFLTTVNKKLTCLKKKKNLLEQYKKGIIQKIFSQELRFKDENGKEYPNWEKKKLGELTFKVGKKNKDNIKYPVYSINNKEGFIPQGEQFEGMDSNNRGYDISMYKIIEKNTFAYNPARINVGSIGYSGELNNVIISSLYVCFKTKKELLDAFLIQYLKTFKFNKSVLRNAEGGVREYLFYENFSNIKIQLPSIKEQNKIADFLTAIDKKINLCQFQIDQTTEWKKGLLQKMFV